MPVANAEVGRIFNELADLLEIQGANEFRVRAYRNAARTIDNLSHSLDALVNNGEDLTELPGIGKDLASKIEAIIKTGSLPQLEDLKQQMPGNLVEMTRIEGLGPKRVKALHEQLGIATIEELRQAAEGGRISKLAGFGAKTEESTLADIKRRGDSAEKEKRLKLSTAEELARPLVDHLSKVKGLKKVDVAGSYRRRKETVGDLDILAVCKRGTDVMKAFVEYEDVDRVISKGTTRSTVVLRFGLQVDLRVVPEISYGAALHYFTGSKAHNVAVRKRGVKQGLKINEYGVFRGKKRIAGRTEEEVYAEVGLPYIEPELREDQGEIEAALEDRLPRLVTLDDIRGDLHSHTKATEGKATLEEMAQAARSKGYEYLAVTDHSQRLAMTHGLDVERLEEQIEAIDALNDRFDGLTLLKGIEVDILEDGSLDLPDTVLRKLDLVVCSVHSKFNLSQEKQTERIIRAINNPQVTILGHPTGRLIGQRDAYQFDVERVMKAAKETGCVLELNAQPERLDLTDVHCRMAKEMGLMVAVSTDAHSTQGLDVMRYGVYQARRGWLEKADVLNTRPLSELKKLLAKR